MERNIFEYASRNKLTFTTKVGVLSVDHLWDLPLTHATKVNLDEIAIALDDKLNAGKKRSFVKDTTTDETTEVSLEIVKHIIDVKQAEHKAAAEARDKNRRLVELREMIATKKNEADAQRSLEDLEAEYNKLRNE